MLIAEYKTKKQLKTQLGYPLEYQETSFFAAEYKSNGVVVVVGPSAENRKWFAEITLKDDLIQKVK